MNTQRLSNLFLVTSILSSNCVTVRPSRAFAAHPLLCSLAAQLAEQLAAQLATQRQQQAGGGLPLPRCSLRAGMPYLAFSPIGEVSYHSLELFLKTLAFSTVVSYVSAESYWNTVHSLHCVDLVHC